MYRIFLAIILLTLPNATDAQVKVSGRVLDLQNKPASNVIVKALEGGKTVAFTSTNLQGTYSLQLKGLKGEEFMLMFSHLSYEKDSVVLKASGKDIRQDMVLCPKWPRQFL